MRAYYHSMESHCITSFLPLSMGILDFLGLRPLFFCACWGTFRWQAPLREMPCAPTISRRFTAKQLHNGNLRITPLPVGTGCSKNGMTEAMPFSENK